jgi:hypothetical protein
MTRALALGALSALAILVSSAGVASAAVPTQYWLNNSKNNPTAHCFTGYGPSSYFDLSNSAPTGSQSSSFYGSAIFGCTQAYPTGATLGAGAGTLQVWLTNTNTKKACTLPWFLLHNAVPSNAGQTITGSGYNLNGYISVPANTTSPRLITLAIKVPLAVLPPNDQLMLMIDGCSTSKLYYGSTSTPTNISLPTLVG